MSTPSSRHRSRQAAALWLGLAGLPTVALGYQQELPVLASAVGDSSSSQYRQQLLVGLPLAGGSASGGAYRVEQDWWSAAAVTLSVTPPGGSAGSGGSSGDSSNTVIVVPVNATVSLTGSGPIQAGAGSTLILSDLVVSSGTQITLPPVAGSGNPGNVTLRFGSQQLSLTAQSSGTVLTVRSIPLGGSTVPVLSLSAGSVQVQASSSGQPLVQLGGVLVQAGSSDTSVQITAAGQLAVSRGMVRLQRNGFSAADVGNADASQVFAGELAELDRHGQLLSQRLGSPQGDAQAVGDPLAATPAWLGSVPRLSGKVARLGDSELLTSLSADLHGVIGQQASEPLTQSAQGVVRVGQAGASQLLLRPVGDIRIEEGRADGITLLADGRAESSQQGVVIAWVPTVGDPAALAAQLAQLDPGITLQPLAAGAWRTVLGERQFVYRPAWLDQLTSDAAPHFSAADADRLHWVDGRQQTLYPALVDRRVRLETLRRVDPAASVQDDGVGGVAVTLAGQAYRLRPQAELRRTPVEQLGQDWWLDAAGRLYLTYPDGWGQALSVDGQP